MAIGAAILIGSSPALSAAWPTDGTPAIAGSFGTCQRSAEFFDYHAAIDIPDRSTIPFFNDDAQAVVGMTINNVNDDNDPVLQVRALQGFSLNPGFVYSPIKEDVFGPSLEELDHFDEGDDFATIVDAGPDGTTFNHLHFAVLDLQNATDWDVDNSINPLTSAVIDASNKDPDGKAPEISALLIKNISNDSFFAEAAPIYGRVEILAEITDPMGDLPPPNPPTKVTDPDVFSGKELIETGVVSTPYQVSLSIEDMNGATVFDEQGWTWDKFDRDANKRIFTEPDKDAKHTAGGPRQITVTFSTSQILKLIEHGTRLSEMPQPTPGIQPRRRGLTRRLNSLTASTS